jgi:hypothetical protein
MPLSGYGAVQLLIAAVVGGAVYVGALSLLGEAPGCGEGRKARDVLDPVEALLFDGGHEEAVDDERRCGVAVIRVETEDRRHGAMLAARLSRVRGWR